MSSDYFGLVIVIL